MHYSAYFTDITNINPFSDKLIHYLLLVTTYELVYTSKYKDRTTKENTKRGRKTTLHNKLNSINSIVPNTKNGKGKGITVIAGIADVAIAP